MDADAGQPTILCGDFNAPLNEDDAGPLPSGREVRSDPVVPAPGWPEDVDKRWIEAEAGVVANRAMPDAYRKVHGNPKRFPASHFIGRRPNRTPVRYDYIFASRDLNPTTCRYQEGWLEEGLSDHAAVEAEFELKHPHEA